MREEKLQQIKEMIPILKSITNQDLAISICNIEGVVLYFDKAETFPLHFDAGHKIENKQDPIYKAMAQGKAIHTIVPKEIFGTKMEANLIPIFDLGKVVGCITSVFSLEKLDELENTNNLMKEMIKESDSSIDNILVSSTNTVNELKEVDNFVNALKENLQDVYTVVDSIKGNANRTKMLALNASIEASRAGEEGKGFKVVASEMGKLSQMSTESVTNINSSLDIISKSIKNVTESIKEINNSALNNLDVVETISSNLSKMLENINTNK